MTRQLNFDLPARPALGRDDFFVADPNAVALAMVERWPDWPGNKLLITGPTGSGKTHLAHVWATRSRARIVPAYLLPQEDIPTLSAGPVAVEDIQEIAGNEPAEHALFHLHNHLLAEGQSLLLTANRAPQHWNLHLPDLASRMQGTTSVTIDLPDDQLLTIVLAKLFADRQIVPNGDVIPYLLRRIDRSFAAAQRVVAAIDALSLSEKRDVTRRLAGRACDQLEQDAG
ncbi:DnaA ATPase domain-containing protein [Pseudooceanicola sp.]|jgi:chromosomal replication initiation ATPase DnaA|uniref:DnaA ATPase domain-containing protein n=1 Tax=Pseudooceanicola sp. TaxID=1914328 RepID=UPI0040587DDA